MKKLYEEDILGDQQYAKDLLNIQSWYNAELKKLNDMLAKKKSDALLAYQRRAIAQKTSSVNKEKQAGENIKKQTGYVDITGTPVNAKGNPPEKTEESYLNILKINDISESKFNTEHTDIYELQSLKDYLDAEGIPYIEYEDEDIIEFDKDELDDEWKEQLDNMDLEELEDEDFEDFKEDKDILSIEDDDEEEYETMFFVKIDDNGSKFVGKIYKLFDEGDWRSKIIRGESESFEKFNYDPDWDKDDIILFLEDIYDEVDIIDEDEIDHYLD